MARRLRRSYLVDSRFQLRWAALGALAGGAIAAWFAAFLWVSLNDQATLLRELVGSEKKTYAAIEDVEVLLLNMPETTPEVAGELRTRFEAQLKTLEDSTRIRNAMMDGIAGTRPYLVGFVSLIMVCLFFWGIVVTHRIAGPMYVIKRQLDSYRTSGRLEPRPLRGGDEFQEVYDSLKEALGKPPAGGPPA